MTRLLPPSEEVLLGDLVGQHDPLAAGGRAARFELLDRLVDAPLLAAVRRGKHEPRVAGIGDDRHAVLRPELIDEEMQRALDQRQLVGVLHRSRHIDQEDEIAGRQVRRVDPPSLEADQEEPVLFVPGAARDLRRHRERLARGWIGIVIGEIVDHLLDAHRVARRPLVLGQEAADIAVGRAIDVDRERREGIAHAFRGTGCPRSARTPRCSFSGAARP